MDVRSLLKASRSTSKRIDHPHAKYNSLGRISCIVCGIQIKSELTWNAHILSKSHKENALKGTESLKRIQSHVQSNISIKAPKLETMQPKLLKTAKPSPTTKMKVVDKQKGKPTDTKQTKEETSEKEKTKPDSIIPEGFFDDPRRDAEARNVPFRDKFDVEMENFQKELGSLDQASDQIVEDDAANTFAVRNLQEIDKQMTMWEKIHALEVEKEKSIVRKKITKTCPPNCGSNPISDGPISVKKEDTATLSVDENDDSDDAELDELNDFRRKLGTR